LLERSGKELLASEILRESARTMGIDVVEPEASHAPATESAKDKAADEEDDEAKPKAKAKPKPALKKEHAEPNPIRRVHFSNFIVQ
jgi:flagellar FliL protein